MNRHIMSVIIIHLVIVVRDPFTHHGQQEFGRFVWELVINLVTQGEINGIFVLVLWLLVRVGQFQQFSDAVVLVNYFFTPISASAHSSNSASASFSVSRISILNSSKLPPICGSFTTTYLLSGMRYSSYE